ncbi:MAG: hypothetical protein RL557_264 [archaeon]
MEQKKELSNIDIEIRFERAKQMIKRKINSLGKQIEREELNVRKVKALYSVNKENFILLDQCEKRLADFKISLINSWKAHLEKAVSFPSKYL